MEVELFAQALQGDTQDVVVVESQGGNFVNWEPTGSCCIVACLDFLKSYECEIGNGDDSFARVAVGSLKA